MCVCACVCVCVRARVRVCVLGSRPVLSKHCIVASHIEKSHAQYALCDSGVHLRDTINAGLFFSSSSTPSSFFFFFFSGFALECEPAGRFALLV